MPKISRKKILVAAGVVFFFILLWGITRSCGKSSKNSYEYEAVSLGKVEKTISVAGVLEVTDTYKVLAKTPGIVKHIYADFNQQVSRGQVLALLDSTDADQRLARIAAQIESARLELAIAAEDLESKKSMFADNLISEKGLERAEFNYKSVQLKQRQMQIDYSIASKARSDTRITAPVSGIVIAKNAEVNSPVPQHAPLFIIAPTLKRMKLTISIDESDIGLMKKGQKVTFTVSAFPDTTFRGAIDQVRITPVMKGGLVTYESIVMCENDELLLKPGMTATATIEIFKKENVLRVPNQAFLVSPMGIPRETEPDVVWKKSSQGKDGLPVVKVPVEIGQRGDNYTEIKKNLEKGDQVLIRYTRGSGD